MSALGSLAGLRVLVTRPADQADTLCRLLERQGAVVTQLPMQSIEPVRQAATAAAQLQQARDAQAWIFTSANAVRHARALDAGVWPRCIAVGPATAAALTQLGLVDVIAPPLRHDSEGVLELPELQDVNGRTVLIVTGEAGREHIEAGLAERGATVIRVEVYRRVSLPHPPEALAQAIAQVDAAIFTSGEALRLMFTRISDDARLRLLDLQLVVPSRRVVEQALELGFQADPLVPEQIGDAAFLRALEQWWGARGRNPRMTDQDETKDTPASPANAAPSVAARPIPDATPDATPGATPDATPAATSAAPQRVPPPPLARSRSGWWGLLWALLVLAVIAAAAWEGYRRLDAMLAERDAQIEQLQRNLDAMGSQVDRVQTRASDQSVAVQRNGAEIARFAERLQAQDDAVGQLREELGGGRTRVQLAVVEQLLMLASDRLQLGREVPAAITALDAADARLAALADPRLFAVREALARERAALQAVPQPDTTGAALALSSLIDRASRLALKAQVPDSFKSQESVTPTPAAAEGGRWQRALDSVRRALSSTFTLRRESGPPRQLLADEQTALIRQVLALKLEGARTALLRRDATTFRELCRSASAWLDDYFNATDPAVSAAQSELVRLQGLELEPPLPDLSTSLLLLRGQLESAPQ